MPAQIDITLSAQEKKQLEKQVRSKTTPVRLVERSRIILLAAQNIPNYKMAEEMEIDANKVGRWRNRFFERGLEGIEKDLPRGAHHGGKNSADQAKLRSKVIKITTQEKPKDGTHWTTRGLAKVMGINHSFISRALDRSQPGLPMKPGRAGTMTHDYKRHGTSTLFAALNTLTGDIIGECKKRHRHQEFLAFLKTVEKQTPKELDLHLIVDNYATHKHETVKNWIKRHKRVHLHFIPTSSSWLNLVERFWRKWAAQDMHSQINN